MKRHRMMLTLDDETHKVLKNFRESTGLPAATLAAHMLKKAVPHIEDFLTSYNSMNFDIRLQGE
jgi:predicted DNA-binding protein